MPDEPDKQPHELDVEYWYLLMLKANAALNGTDATALAQQTAHLALPPISAYLTTRAAEKQTEILAREETAQQEQQAILTKQETLLNGMQKHSTEMLWLTRLLAILTVALLVNAAISLFA